MFPFMPLCDNPQQILSSMRFRRNLAIGLCGVVLGPVLAQAQTQAPAFPRTAPTAPPPLVLAGGTIIDVSEWGHSAKDLEDAVVIVRDGRISEVGSRYAITIPKGARVLDCTGKFILPGLVDGFAGVASQGQASANLYMGVTTVVATNDERHGKIDFSANPSPHLYLLDSVGTTDKWSLLIDRPEWAARLKEGAHPAELSPEDTARQMGMVTYGEFVATPYSVGVEAGVDVLLHMSRYELGVIPDELQRPLVEDPEEGAAVTAYDYSERLPATGR